MGMNRPFKLPQMQVHDTITAAVPRKVYANAHAYHINSISVNSDGETYISADDLRINLWNLGISDQSFSMSILLPCGCTCGREGGSGVVRSWRRDGKKRVLRGGVQGDMAGVRRRRSQIGNGTGHQSERGRGGHARHVVVDTWLSLCCVKRRGYIIRMVFCSALAGSIPRGRANPSTVTATARPPGSLCIHAQDTTPPNWPAFPPDPPSHFPTGKQSKKNTLTRKQTLSTLNPSTWKN